MTPDRSKDLDRWIDLYVDHLAGGRGEAPNLEDLAPEIRDEARQQAFVISELWGRDAGPGDEPSKLAVAFGFDQLDTTPTVDGTKIRAARKTTGLKVSELARKLTGLGWTISAAQLGELESGKRLTVPGGAIPLLVACLNITADELTTTTTAKIDQLLASDRIRGLISDAAQRLGKSFDEISSLLRPQLASVHFRERDSQEDDIAEVVKDILGRIN